MVSSCLMNAQASIISIAIRLILCRASSNPSMAVHHADVCSFIPRLVRRFVIGAKLFIPPERDCLHSVKNETAASTLGMMSGAIGRLVVLLVSNSILENGVASIVLLNSLNADSDCSTRQKLVMSRFMSLAISDIPSYSHVQISPNPPPYGYVLWM